VRVLATTGRTGTADPSTSVVVPDAEVAEVVYQPRSSLLAGGAPGATSTGEPVVLRVLVSDDEAVALARAKATGTVEVVLLPSDGRQGQGGPP
jgi:hypothetical protein